MIDRRSGAAKMILVAHSLSELQGKPTTPEELEFIVISDLVDVDRVIKERDVSLVERHIPTVLQYVLEGDQSEILDRNFVNLFRMSQLSVEYLLFCKKYLDHTVTILKKDIPKLKQEIKQLRSYTEELELHISLLTKNNLVATFRCEICSKAFSSEEYLNSHLKRRHNEENKLNSNIEAEKLHMEIKELKERLNNTEKCLRKDHDEEESDKLRDDELGASKLINEIQKNFEKFREQVENKIESLHSEKNFYDDKYDKLFNVVLGYRSKEENQQNKQEGENVSKESPVKHAVIKESTTQTEHFEKSQKLQIETVQTDSIYEYKEDSKEELPVEDDHLHKEILEKKMDTFGETIENKISTGLFSIENQMKAFWEKLTELESNQHKNIITTELEHPEQSIRPLPSFSATTLQTQDEKPKIKPRTKFSKPTSLPKTHENAREVEKIRTELGAILSKPKKELLPKMVQSAVSLHDETSSSETESEPESIEKEPSEVISDFKRSAALSDGMHEIKFEKTKNPDIKKSKSLVRSVVSVKKATPPRKHGVTVRKAKPVDHKLSEERIKKEMSEILYSRLQEMGISPSWKGIPKKTFHRALEIVEHQANLDKKLLPNYDSVKKSIEKSLGLDKALKKKSGEGLGDSPKVKNEKSNVIKIRYMKKTEEKEPRSQPVVTIKNRSMYDTDTDSEAAADHVLSPSHKIEKNQAAVIEELKILQSKSMPSRTADTDSDLNSILLSDDRNTLETKSAMKSYPSDGSLVKKKVLFDIKGAGTENKVLGRGGSTVDLTRQMNIEQTKSNADSSFSDFEVN